MIGVASVSKTFLKTARGLLASAVEERHMLEESLLTPRSKNDLRGVDLLFCDSLAMAGVRSQRKVLSLVCDGID